MPTVITPDGFVRKKPDFPEIPGYFKWIIVGALLLVVGFVLIASCFFVVDTDSQAVVLRFGKLVRTAEPGLHFKFPWPVERSLTRPVSKIQTLEFGFRTLRAGKQTQYARPTDQDEDVKRMLTGDLNIASVEWIVQYRIRNLPDYLFHTVDVPTTIRDVSESVMRRIIGDSSIDEVITTNRGQIAADAKEEIQGLLNQYNCGVQIIACKLQAADPPAEVKDAFDAVNRAMQEMDQKINQARGERNSKIPAERGKKEKKIAEAEAYRDQRVLEAKGKASAIKAQIGAYREDPESTRLRLYLEAMEEVYSQVGNKTVIDQNLPGITPFLNLGEGELPIQKGGQK